MAPEGSRHVWPPWPPGSVSAPLLFAALSSTPRRLSRVSRHRPRRRRRPDHRRRHAAPHVRGRGAPPPPLPSGGSASSPTRCTCGTGRSSSSRPSTPGSRRFRSRTTWHGTLVALSPRSSRIVVIENPIRHARPLLRGRWASVGLGVGLIAVTLRSIAVESHLAIGSDSSGSPSATSTRLRVSEPLVSLPQVLKAVTSADRIRKLPGHLDPPLSKLIRFGSSYLGFPPANSGCVPGVAQGSVPNCAFGDGHGSRTMVLYGDSHAGMWFQAIDQIAIPRALEARAPF